MGSKVRLLSLCLMLTLFLAGCGSPSSSKTSATSSASGSTGTSEGSSSVTASSTAVWKDGSKAGEERSDNGIQLKLVWCPAGKFQMGSPATEEGRHDDEGPVQVTLSHGFWIGKYEVTQREWEQVMHDNPCKGPLKKYVKVGPDFPVAYLHWDRAMEFCQKLTADERQANRLPMDWEYTLPTEAQWEYACRAGTTTRFYFGDDAKPLEEHAWFGAQVPGERSTGGTENFHAQPVGQKKPNPWGLYDMYGNVWEWCRDARVNKLPGGTDPVALSGDEQRAARGISFSNKVKLSRSAARYANNHQFEHYTVGLRLAAVKVKP